MNSEKFKSRPGAPFTVMGALVVNTAAALVVPVFSFLLSEQSPTVVSLVTDFLISAVYANCIGFLAQWITPQIFPFVAHRGPLVQWSVFVVALVVLSSVGCALATAMLMLADWASPALNLKFAGFWPMFGYTAKLCILITLVFGLVIAVYECLQDRLQTTELRLRTEELERERTIKLATEARLAALEARLHPHFLFNTLNSISSLIPVDPERAERLVERMAALLRFSLDSHRGGLVPLEQEMKIVRDYLEIEQARLGDRLRYRLDVAEEFFELAVPPLSIQTLVENSIKFAVAPNREGGEIQVHAHRHDGSLRIDVTDTGKGFSLEGAPSGHGLDNLRGRLAVLFGDATGLTVGRTDGWTKVSLKVPA